MPTGNFDSSQITNRRRERAIAGSYITRAQSLFPTPVNASLQTNYNASVVNAIKTGHMTEYSRNNTCTTINPGCPQLTSPYSPVLPGVVTGITFSVGSIVVSWQPPLKGDAPFTYQVTPYLNGLALPSIYTGETTYKFTDLQEWQPYTFTITAINAAGSGATVTSPSYFLAPPSGLSSIMSGNPTPVLPEPSLKYVINAGLDSMLQYIASVNLGPTRGSRYIYVWITSIVSAWNWVRSESRITGIHDTWDWTLNKAHTPLNNNDSIIWLCSVIDYITPYFIPSGYKSIYNCPVDIIARVKTVGEWDRWVTTWHTWYNYRQGDGFVGASAAQPTTSANWGQTIIVDGINNISGFPKPLEWTRLTVQGKKQNYLTYSWDNVLSSCLSEANEQAIQSSVSPAIGSARDLEIDVVKDYTAALTDEQKIIAEFWAGGPGTVSPPLMFIWFWKTYICMLPNINCSTIMYSLQDLAIHLFEGGRVTWRLKSAWMEDRPIQEIRRRYSGQLIQSWNGMIDGAQWIPYQEANFVTPPFADFPSGHSHFSKAFALTMNKWFGNTITKTSTFYDQLGLICPLFTTNETIPFGDFKILAGTSKIQSSVPESPVTLSFLSWNEMADSAGISRLYGGIHALTAHASSQKTAVEVDGYINSTWSIKTS